MAAKTQTHGKVGVESYGHEGIFFKYLLTCCAATVAETATYPLDLTKTRLQIQGEGGRSPLPTARQPCGGSPAYRGMVGTACGIVREEGLHKLWQGVSPALYRHLVYTGSRMAFYEWIRQHVLGKNADGTYAVWKAMVSGLVSGAMAQFIASPTDLVKVQMQMEGRRLLEGHTSYVKTTRQMVRQIFAERGVRGLWRGWMPNVQRAALVNLGDLTTYDTVKHQILKHSHLSDNYVTHALSSCCSGLVAATLGTPADVIKTRIMNQASQNGKILYKSSIDCLIQTVSKEGFFALYKGFLPTWARMAPWSLTFWLSYEHIRRIAGTSSF